METKQYSGWLMESSWGEGDDILYLKKNKEHDDLEPLAEILESDLEDKLVSVRYFISEKEETVEEAQEAFIKELYGQVDTDVGHHYSEITGYLWTDEEINIGGHDLIDELHSYIGKWLNLIVDIHA